MTARISPPAEPPALAARFNDGTANGFTSAVGLDPRTRFYDARAAETTVNQTAGIEDVRTAEYALEKDIAAVREHGKRGKRMRLTESRRDAREYTELAPAEPPAPSPAAVALAAHNARRAAALARRGYTELAARRPEPGDLEREPVEPERRTPPPASPAAPPACYLCDAAAPYHIMYEGEPLCPECHAMMTAPPPRIIIGGERLEVELNAEPEPPAAYRPLDLAALTPAEQIELAAWVNGLYR